MTHRVYELMWYGEQPKLRGELTTGDEVVIWYSGYSKDSATYRKVVRTTKTQIILKGVHTVEGDRYYKKDGRRVGSRSSHCGTSKTLYALTPELRAAILVRSENVDAKRIAAEAKADAYKRAQRHPVWGKLNTKRLVGLVEIFDDMLAEIEDGDAGVNDVT